MCTVRRSRPIFHCGVSLTYILLGEGSFFKTHQDTPRSEDMFGSLVCLLPSPHEGGNLLLRHRNHEFTFDGQALLYGSPPGSIAWVAFFGDVEHEVAYVTSGHRITITFNLYFDSTFGGPIPQATSEHLFKSALKKLIDDPLLSSVHPYLGFGLDYAYPYKKAVLDPRSINLKGIDATLIRTFNELGIEYDFYLLYREGEYEDGCPLRILSKNILDGKYLESGCNYDRLLSTSFVVSNPIVRDPQNPLHKEPQTSQWEYVVDRHLQEPWHPRMDVEWVTKPQEDNLDRSVAMIHGNEAFPGFFYHFLCVVAKISEPDNEGVEELDYYRYSDPDMETTDPF